MSSRTKKPDPPKLQHRFRPIEQRAPGEDSEDSDSFEEYRDRRRPPEPTRPKKPLQSKASPLRLQHRAKPLPGKQALPDKPPTSFPSKPSKSPSKAASTLQASSSASKLQSSSKSKTKQAEAPRSKVAPSKIGPPKKGAEMKSSIPNSFRSSRFVTKEPVKVLEPKKETLVQEYKFKQHVENSNVPGKLALEKLRLASKAKPTTVLKPGLRSKPEPNPEEDEQEEAERMRLVDSVYARTTSEWDELPLEEQYEKLAKIGTACNFEMLNCIKETSLPKRGSTDAEAAAFLRYISMYPWMSLEFYKAMTAHLPGEKLAYLWKTEAQSTKKVANLTPKKEAWPKPVELTPKKSKKPGRESEESFSCESEEVKAEAMPAEVKQRKILHFFQSKAAAD